MVACWCGVPIEYARGIRRGKLDRRRQANEKRTRGEGNIFNAIKEDS